MPDSTGLQIEGVRRAWLPLPFAACSVALGVGVLVGWVSGPRRVDPGLPRHGHDEAERRAGVPARWPGALVDPRRPAGRPSGGRALAGGRGDRGLDALRVLAASTWGSTNSSPGSRPMRSARSTRGGCTRRRRSISSCSGWLRPSWRPIASTGRRRGWPSWRPIAGSTLIGYLYGVREFVGLAIFSQMALHTTMGMLAVSAGLLLARRAEG